MAAQNLQNGDEPSRDESQRALPPEGTASAKKPSPKLAPQTKLAAKALPAKGANPKKGKGPLPILSVLADTPSIPDKVFARLPRPIQRALKAFTEQAERDVFTTASLGVLSGCLPNTSGRYDTGRFSPPLFICVTAPAASGKGTLSHARRLGDEVERLFQDQYLEQKKDQEANRKPIMDPAVFETRTPTTGVSAPPKGEGNADSGEQPIIFRLEGDDLKEFLSSDTPDAKPSPKKVANRRRGPDLSGGGDEPFLRRLILSGDISSSALIQALEENGGFGIVFETEIDTVVKSQKQDWGGTSDTFRKAHAHETV